ncbi:CHAP domain-containing protein [Actinomadura rugatobispora]|uniref:CHAP domain-containing protein n=1 Tax=Actinomadura rugatobispora TaxID=1994 RepID=A0ABW1AJF5_9ACTN|nr:hypothetical protein GCM10010200_072900 [Actinomadura rugatobispora]
MAGKHRTPQPPSITLRITGRLVAGAVVVGLAAATAQASLNDTGGPSPQRSAAMMAAGAESRTEPETRKGAEKASESSSSSSSSSSAKAKAAKRERPTAQDAIRLAREQVGISEDGGGETKFQDWYKSTDRAKETVARDGGSLEGYSDAAWCSMFISWIGDRIGLSDQLGMDAWTVAHAEWFKDHDRWGTEPRPGAIVFFNWGGSKDVNDIVHVGMVIKDNGDGTVKTVEGNTSNAVMVRERSTGSIVGYGYPEYAKS